MRIAIRAFIVWAVLQFVGACPAPAAPIAFGAPTAIGSCACATLDIPGNVCGAASFGFCTPITVTTATQTITFTNDNSVATLTQALGQGAHACFACTNNANFNTALNEFAFDCAPTITLNNLTIGETYQIQLFGLDNRLCEACRTMKFDACGTSSAPFREGCDVFVLGTFTADATTQTVRSNGVAQGQSNFNAVIVRTPLPEPELPLMLTSLLGVIGWRYRQAA